MSAPRSRATEHAVERLLDLLADTPTPAGPTRVENSPSDASREQPEQTRTDARRSQP